MENIQVYGMDIVNKIRILHITPQLTVGGAEQKLLYIIKKLDKEAFAQHVIYSIPGPLVDEIEKEGAPLSRFNPMSWSPLSSISLLRIYSYIKKNRIDLVHCHLDAAYVIGGIAAIMARVPVVFSFQNMADERFLSEYKIFKYLDKALSHYTEAFLVESEAVVQVLSSWGIEREKLTIVPNGVELADPVERNKRADIKKRLEFGDCFVVGNIARLVDFKNQQLLLHAAAQVLKKRDDVKFVLVGDGPMRTELYQLGSRLGISRHVFFPGTILDFTPYIESFDIFVLSSLTESSPMALLHAFAHGVPVVSTAVGDIPSIIRHEENGILVPLNDVGAMAGAILELLSDGEKRDRIARAGWETAQTRFSVDAMIQELLRVYYAVLEGRKALMGIGEKV